ncbi:hypothetical protein GCM10010365_07840 [Streptomyces poonensis]|uniref:Secreted protein n=1 Tax=Streptomyces poonensis TaxID=68255 RepID=A0A918P8X9_9ACTN|nr:hypothetical protein GCM10010365_07840 [Streptomyces poonensis]GLJ87778.1 hypothetical protein GCM10017589_03780 [Streptomyces poonensis]
MSFFSPPSSLFPASLLVPPQAVAASASDATPTATRVSLDIRRIVKFPILQSPAVGAEFGPAVGAEFGAH